MGCCICSGNCNHTGPCSYCINHQAQKVNINPLPSVCPTCGRCPICGKSNKPIVYEWPSYPYTMPHEPWISKAPTICSCQ